MLNVSVQQLLQSDYCESLLSLMRSVRAGRLGGINFSTLECKARKEQCFVDASNYCVLITFNVLSFPSLCIVFFEISMFVLENDLFATCLTSGWQ
jgi:hypothetical protein